MNNNIIESDLPSLFGKRYLDYAMYVAKDRALPSIADGCKNVQRRILFGMHELGLAPNKPFKKSARAVGDVMGKYHPHGDSSVYGAMVILAQDFSMRYPLVEGHGNFGSIDGDDAAAMRYTEARLSKIGQYMLNDINKDTVDFKLNYDGEENEPVVLPTIFPNLLVNGVSGIAVGLATDIPSHNLKDVLNCLYHTIDSNLQEQETEIDDLIKIIQAPDFATGGEIIGINEIIKGYKTGKGKCTLRGKSHTEENKKGTNVVITELPFKTNKQNLVNKIAENLKDKKNSKGTIIERALFPQVREIRDESNKDGIRIVLELRPNESPEILINNLIKQDVGYQSNIKMNFIALDGKIPMECDLKFLIDNFIVHSSNVLRRKTEFDLNKSKERLNIVEGVLRLFDECPSNEYKLNMDAVIDSIRNSENPIEDMLKLKFNLEQIKYICEMKLRNLSRVGQDKYTVELSELSKKIAEGERLIGNYKELLKKLREEFETCEKLFGDERRTSINVNACDIEDEDLIEDEKLVITYTTDGVIKAVEEKVYNTQKRGGKGVQAGNTKDSEAIKFMFTSNSKDDLLFFTNSGRCFTLKAYKIGKSTKSAKGKSINNYLTLEPGEKILNVLNVNIKESQENYLLMITKLGTIKKLALSELSTRYSYTRVMTFKEKDNLVQALLIKDEDVMIVTKKGMSIKINTNLDGNKAIRPMGRTACGVRAMTLKEEDRIVDMCIVRKEDKLLTITEKGLGKRSAVSEWKITSRGTKGVTAHKLSTKTGDIVCALVANCDEELIIATGNGLIQKIKNDEIRECGRNSVGVKIMNLDEDIIVSASSCKVESEETDND